MATFVEQAVLKLTDQTSTAMSNVSVTAKLAAGTNVGTTKTND